MFEIQKPILLVDRDKCLKNIRMMNEKAFRSNVVFRPHFKTHQSHGVASWFRDSDVGKITVSSVTMAEYFAENDWNDITIAFPVNIPEIDRLNHLAEKVTLHLLIDHPEQIRYLNNKLNRQSGFFIKTNHGYGRAGILPENRQAIKKLIGMADKKKLVFKGFLTHAGNAYQAKDRQEISFIFRKCAEELAALKADIKSQSGDIMVSVGDTPSCSVVDDFSTVDEVRPGNFVFYDLMQYDLGSCRLEDIAVCMACPVVSKYPDRKQALIYGGAIHFSKDFIVSDGKKIFGRVVFFKNNKWQIPEEEIYLTGISQEHGIIDLPTDANKIKVGDIIGVLPVHSCLTVNCMKEYYTFDGEKITTLYA